MSQFFQYFFAVIVAVFGFYCAWIFFRVTLGLLLIFPHVPPVSALVVQLTSFCALMISGFFVYLMIAYIDG